MRPPVVLSIAGSDPSGGAGIQADLKTFSALGAYGCAAITALTAQSTRGVSGVFAVPAAFVAEQIEALLADIEVDAVKIGMLADAGIAHAVADVLERRRPPATVLDPVMAATSGDRLLAPDAEQALRDRLLPLADIITPNLAEAAALLGAAPARDEPARRDQVRALQDLGARRVLLKGGHQVLADAEGPMALDLLGEPGAAPAPLRQPWIDTANTHGTGCTLSSAIAVERARRPGEQSWMGACEAAREYLASALRGADELSIGHGHGPVSHFARWPGWARGAAGRGDC
ncbi:MAG: bifunctional hydroxymethylpyrimidine kinase/phosphomethylpyrimidine kinase [Frankiaceae bacterium]|jgi:hydroxymethylpyrimidine/phosphomethylpyrimidine kinase|nr:bifunctional hydroxymethylpyrimidine kinase/phosphomethylpyrimidine kinase [Frankiaceae bacterium]